MRNRIEAGGADCPSVSSGLAVPGEAEIGGFLRGSTTACGGGSLRAVLIFFFGAVGDVFGIFSGATTRGDSGAVWCRVTPRLRPGSSRYRANGKCWLSGHRPQRTPRYRGSRKGRTKRAQPAHGHALTSRSLALRAPIVDVGAGARMAPQGCHTVNPVPPACSRGRAPAPPELSPRLQDGRGGDCL